MASSSSTALETICDASVSELSACKIDLLKAALEKVNKAIDAGGAHHFVSHDIAYDVVNHAQNAVSTGLIESEEFRNLRDEMADVIKVHIRWNTKWREHKSIEDRFHDFFLWKGWETEEHKEDRDKWRRIIELDDVLRLDLTGLAIAENSFRQTGKSREPAVLEKMRLPICQLAYEYVRIGQKRKRHSMPKSSARDIDTPRESQRSKESRISEKRGPVDDASLSDGFINYSIPKAVPTHNYISSEPYTNADTSWEALLMDIQVQWQSCEGEDHYNYLSSSYHN